MFPHFHGASAHFAYKPPVGLSVLVLELEEELTAPVVLNFLSGLIAPSMEADTEVHRARLTEQTSISQMARSAFTGDTTRVMSSANPGSALAKS